MYVRESELVCDVDNDNNARGVGVGARSFSLTEIELTGSVVLFMLGATYEKF